MEVLSEEHSQTVNLLLVQPLIFLLFLRAQKIPLDPKRVLWKPNSVQTEAQSEDQVQIVNLLPALERVHRRVLVLNDINKKENRATHYVIIVHQNV